MNLKEENSDFVYLGKRIDKALNYIQHNELGLVEWFKQYVEIPYQDIVFGELDLEEEDYIFSYLDSLLDDMEEKFNIIFENKMDKETLRMQMLAGVITESEYKAKVEKLAEGAFDNPNAPKIAEPQKGGSLQLKNAAMKIYSYIKKNGFTPYLMVDGKNIGDRMNHDFAIQVQGAGGHGASSSLAADGLLTISGNQNKTNPQVMEKLQNDIIHDFSFLTKHSQSNPSGLVIRLAVDPKANVSEELDEKESLNEHAIGGIVGVGAINTIPPRAKTDYEDAFEHFLGQKYNLNEEESVNENTMAVGNEVEHPEGTGTIELVTDYASYADEIDANLGMDWESMTPKEELTWYKIKGDDGETYWFDEEELSEFN